MQTSATKQMITAFFWAVTQLVAVIYYRRFGTIGPFWRIKIYFYSWSSKMRPIVWPEMSLRNYHYSMRIKPGDRGYLPTLHYLFCIAHPTYAVHWYWITIQYLAWNAVLKHSIIQFSSGVYYFFTFSSRHFLQHSYPQTYFNFRFSPCIITVNHFY